MGTLYVVATPIGNLGDISTRLIDTLRSVSLICVEDTRVTIKLLNHFEIKTKMISYHKFNEESRSKEIIAKLVNDEDVALVSDAGTPCISDPGYELIKNARENNIEVIGIPGPSAIINALAISGLPSTTFTFYGFLSTDTSKFNKEIEEIKNSDVETFVFYESPKRIVKLVDKLSIHFPNAKISIASDMTKKFERNFFGNIKEVLEIIKNDEKIEKGEYVIVLNKQKEATEKETAFAIEALLINELINNNCSIKEAIKLVNEKYKELSKNDIYEASLKLKELFDK